MDNMMQMMMQMMMQQNQMMTMLMTQMSQQQTSPLPTPTETPTVTFESQGISQDVQGQLKAMQSEIESLKSQLAAAKSELATAQADKRQFSEKHFMALQELNTLKRTVGRAEAYLGKKIEDVADLNEELGGDDFYDEHKEEWDKEGISNQEKHSRVKAYKDLFTDGEDEGFGSKMTDFSF